MSVKLSHKEDKNRIMNVYRESFFKIYEHIFLCNEKSLVKRRR